MSEGSNDSGDDTDSTDTERKQGFLTEADRRWLRLTDEDTSSDQDAGSSSPSDQKRRCRAGIVQAMNDIHDLVNSDFEAVENLDGLPELLEGLGEDTDLTVQDCVRDLTALAYVLTYSSIDYTQITEELELHPRDSSESPRDEDRTTAGGPLGGSDSDLVSDIVAFRRGIAEGIARGRAEFNEDTPNIVLINSNAKLYKEPTREELRPMEGVGGPGIDMDDVRDALAQRLDASSRFDVDDEEAESKISHEDAVHYMKTEIEGQVWSHLRHLRNAADEEVQPVDRRL